MSSWNAGLGTDERSARAGLLSAALGVVVVLGCGEVTGAPTSAPDGARVASATRALVIEPTLEVGEIVVLPPCGATLPDEVGSGPVGGHRRWPRWRLEGYALPEEPLALGERLKVLPGSYPVRLDHGASEFRDATTFNVDVRPQTTTFVYAQRVEVGGDPTQGSWRLLDARGAAIGDPAAGPFWLGEGLTVLPGDYTVRVRWEGIPGAQVYPISLPNAPQPGAEPHCLQGNIAGEEGRGDGGGGATRPDGGASGAAGATGAASDGGTPVHASCDLTSSRCAPGQACMLVDAETGRSECRAGACHLLGEECGAGMKCGYDFSAPGGPVRACLPAGTTPEGAPCGEAEGGDTCVRGTTCLRLDERSAPVCTRFCLPVPGACPEAQSCVGAATIPGTDERPLVCAPTPAQCDVLAQDCPAAGDTCYPVAVTSTREALCLPAGPTPAGGSCDASAPTCVKGAICVTSTVGSRDGRCVVLCDLANARGTCGPRQFCRSPAAGAAFGVCL